MLFFNEYLITIFKGKTYSKIKNKTKKRLLQILFYLYDKNIRKIVKDWRKKTTTMEIKFVSQEMLNRFQLIHTWNFNWILRINEGRLIIEFNEMNLCTIMKQKKSWKECSKQYLFVIN